MLTFYISMLETEEQQDKFSYIYQNYVGSCIMLQRK